MKIVRIGARKVGRWICNGGIEFIERETAGGKDCWYVKSEDGLLMLCLWDGGVRLECVSD